MTIKELKELIKDLPDDMPIHKTEGDFYPAIRKANINGLYALTDEERKSSYSFRTRTHMTVERWFGDNGLFGPKKEYANNPRVFDCLLVDWG